MSSEEIRKSFLDFFKKKGSVIVPSSSLVPADSSVLLTTAGMQQFKPYFTGELDPKRDFGSLDTVSIQKCFRTTDIDEVGDRAHLTFFEMLGNFSFGGYSKKESILWAYEYVTQVLKISPDRIAVSVFHGDKEVPKDAESFDIWHREAGLPKDKIKLSGRQDNFWGPTGDEGPCGPTTEIYVDGIEIWNLVFNQYFCRKDKTLEKSPMSGVDTGMGLERLAAVLRGVDDVFETDIFHPLISEIYALAPDLRAFHDLERKKRIIRVLADHLRGSIFLIADGVRPSNKEAGYILRRLLRRILAYQIVYEIVPGLFEKAAKIIQEKFGEFYPEVSKTKEILEVFNLERDKFQKAIAAGLRELRKYKDIGSKEAFYLYETFGLSFELIKEMAAPDVVKSLNREDFEKEFKKHQETSRAGMEKKFGGHGLLLDNGELKAGNEEELKKVLKLHTATHLLQAALRKILGSEVKQMGSDITAERTRFDFTFSRKLTAEEIKKVEDLVNETIAKDLPVGFVELPKSEAEKIGALHFFKAKYPEKVKVYYIGHSLEGAFSKEFCGGPHVNRLLEIGRFKIAKEESISAGVRRIRGIVTGY